jgi:hypothetical protein
MRCLIEPISGSPLPLLVSRWSLEAPHPEAPLASADIMEIRGWALTIPEKQHCLHLVLRLKARTLSFPMNIERPDVINLILGQDPEHHPQLTCGFRYGLPLQEAIEGFTIGFETDLEIHPAVEIKTIRAEHPDSAR